MHNLIEVYDTLKTIVGEKYFITDAERLYMYAKDCTSNQSVMPNAVIIPSTIEEISKVLNICNINKIKVTVRGGGTGVSGGTLAHQGIILSLERLNKIIEINKVDRIAIVEAGVVTQTLQNAAIEKGLFFPQNISSSNACFIGGNVAVSSGSPKSLKYGPTKNYILNLEVVLPDGRIIWTGKNVNKNATGYNFTQLFVGSEGTLGIITKVVLQLVSLVEEILILVPFQHIDSLFRCVQQFFAEGFSASSIEFIDQKGYEIVSNFFKKTNYFKNNVAGLLWLEFEGKDKQQLLKEIAKVTEFIYKFTEDEILVAESNEDVKELWNFRKKLGDAVINLSSFKDVDIVVPRSKIYQMYLAIRNIADEYRFKYTVFGHIGDGNFHINILSENSSSENQSEKIISEAIKNICTMAVQLGGTISGEHGIGSTQRSYLNLAIPEYQIDFMKKIKEVFDPNDILNSGKIF